MADIVPQGDRKGALVIPCDADQFAGFMESLLGKSNNISGGFKCIFDLDYDKIKDIFYRIKQRVKEQNSGSLYRFNASLYYNDGSSVSLSSLAEFESYAETRPIRTIGVNLT